MKQSCTFLWVDTSMATLNIVNRSSLQYTLMFLRSYYPISGFPDTEYLDKTFNGIQDVMVET